MPIAHAVPAPEDARLTLVTLGGVSLSRTDATGDPETVPVRGKPLALLVYLACSPGCEASREHLLDLLWADSDADAGRAALRAVLYRIRRDAGDGIISAGGDTVALLAPLACDRDEFLRALKAKDYAAAVRQYVGDFLPSFAVPSGGASFERWADLERRRLRGMFVQAGGTVIRRLLNAGHPHDALVLARRARDAAPTDESVWRLLLEALVSAQDIMGAALAADAVEEMLAEQEREPEPATVPMLRLARQLPSPDGPPVGRRALVSELIGRESEFAAVIATWNDGQLGPTRHFHVTGAPGVGKTRLLTDLRARLSTQRTRPVTLRCNQGERQVPYTVAGELAAALGRLRGASGVSPGVAGSLVALNPSLSTVFPSATPETSTGGEALRCRVIALVELLEAITENRPTAIFIDDLHWADAPSRQVLLAVIAKAREHAALFVTAGRPDAVDVRTSETVVLELAPLEPFDVGELVARLGVLPQAAWADRLGEQLHAATGGSPLLVLETLQLAIERGTLVHDADGWHCPDVARLRVELERGGALRHRIEQLDPESRAVLRVLAVAGVPLAPRRLARAVRMGDTDAEAALATLEQRGLASRTGDEWRPAHDEIASATLDASDPRDRTTACGALGRAFAEEAGHDTAMLRRAAPLLAAGGDDARLASVFARWVAEAHARGDRRRLADLADELLGDESRPDRVARLIAGLPLYRRLGLDSGRRVAAAAALALAALGTIAIVAPQPGDPAPDVLLVGIGTEDGGTPVARVAPISRTRWSEQDTIVLSQARTYPGALFADNVHSIASHPDGGRWVVARVTPDSGGVDLWLVDGEGRERRLTRTPGDDWFPRWSPDGRFIVFATDRWGAGRSRADIAVLDTTTLGVRALTGGAEYDSFPVWSPDGTRVAFLRFYFDSPQPTALCWTPVEPRSPRCLTPGDFTVQALLGWKDPEHLLAVVDSGGASALASVDLAGSAVHFVGSGNGVRVVSPDGQWVACRCTRRGYRGLAWYAFHVDRPDEARRVSSRGDPRQASAVRWEPVPRRARFLHTLDIEAQPESIARDTRHRLRVRGADSGGEEVGVYAVHWRSGDTTVATIDADGILTPHRQGTVRVHASAGGWRSDSTTVTIGTPRSRLRLDEDWRGPLTEGWVPFGEPRPRTTAGPDGVAAFLNGGDSTWVSGAYSRSDFDAAAGLGLETTVSGPVTDQWQYVEVMLGPASDSAAISRWDHRTGYVWPLATACAVGYPRMEGVGARGQIALWIAELHRTVRLEPESGGGRSFTLRMQLFPDGRCGFAINGRPVWVSENDVPVDRPFRILLQGKSYHAKLLVGRLQVWEGVRGDIDWSAADPVTAGRARPRR